MQDGLFFSIDTYEILLNGKSYGGSIESVDYSEGKIIFSMFNGESIEVTIDAASVDYPGLMSTEDKEKLDRLPEGDVIDEIYNVVYTQHSNVTINRSPSIIEKGVSTPVTINWNYLFNGVTATPDSMTLTSGEDTLVSDASIKTYSENITDTKNYVATAINKGITKTVSTVVNAYYPMYFGSSINTSLTSPDILALNKQNIKASPAGSYSFSVGQGEYVWLCVPSTMTINRVTSGGFDVPFESPATIAVEGKDNYKCYRSSSTFVAGTFNCVIS